MGYCIRGRLALAAPVFLFFSFPLASLGLCKEQGREQTERCLILASWGSYVGKAGNLGRYDRKANMMYFMSFKMSFNSRHDWLVARP